MYPPLYLPSELSNQPFILVMIPNNNYKPQNNKECCDEMHSKGIHPNITPLQQNSFQQYPHNGNNFFPGVNNMNYFHSTPHFNHPSNIPYPNFYNYEMMTHNLPIHYPSPFFFSNMPFSNNFPKHNNSPAFIQSEGKLK